jgi:hypothetical protein
MAFIYITEHYAPSLLSNAGQIVPVVKMPPTAEQKVANDGVSTQSAAFNDRTTIIGIHSDSICSVAFGASPTATVANRRLAANSTEYFEVIPGQKLAVILNT